MSPRFLLTLLILSATARAEDCGHLQSSVLDQEKLIVSAASALTQEPACLTPVISGEGDPEPQLRVAMEGLSDDEVFTRLILAETMASRCASADVARGIAWVLRNRVQARDSARFGLGREVAFKRAQFRSSTGSCDVAMRRAFLCPSSLGADWTARWREATAAYGDTQASGARRPFPANVHQYFFNRHFDQSVNCARGTGVQPAWASPAHAARPDGLSIDPGCVSFYR